MAEKQPTVLFLTPGASSVGGNIFILNFLKWMKANSSISFVTVYGHGGDLEKEFESLGPAYVFEYERKKSGLAYRVLRKIRKQLRWNERRIRRELKKHDIRLIYSNAVTNDDVLTAFSDLDVPVISHCHELESHIQRKGIDGFNRTKARTDLFVAVSDAVRQNLILNHDIPADKIELMYEFIPVSELPETEIRGFRAKIFRELGIPENAFIVGGSGTLYWRKAPDLFIQIAAKVGKLAPDRPIYFIWIGGGRKGDFVLFELNYDAKKLGIKDRVFFIEHTARPFEYFAAMDVFLMVSREDPFPLVCLEAASMGKPVICFAEAGGMPEFVQADCGFVIPYLDLDTASEKIIELFDDPSLKMTLGVNAMEKVKLRHDIEVSAPPLLEIVKRYIPAKLD